MQIVRSSWQDTGNSYRRYWQRLVTCGRAHELLRSSLQRHIAMMQREIGFEYIRFHGLFMDEMMVYHTNDAGEPIYNWFYVDEVFDYLLSVNLKPFVELSFMPEDMASGKKYIFWWKGNITPPKEMGQWADLITEFIKHCIERYGEAEVLSWYFEVWNEPNLKDWFFSGDQADYFELYKVTVQAIRHLLPQARVGGPSTSNFKNGKAPWVEDFITFCQTEQIPLDFVSTHPYPNSFPLDTGGGFLEVYRPHDSALQDLSWLRRTIDSACPEAEIHLTEWNSSPNSRDLVHDTAFMAPWVIKNNLDCIGLVDSLGFWTCSDIFEENRAGDTLFHGGFGMMSINGLRKPSYHGYWFLSQLKERIVAKGEGYVVTRDDSSFQVLLYNYVHYDQSFAEGNRDSLTHRDRYTVFLPGEEKRFDVVLEEIDAGMYEITTVTFDREHGSVYDVWNEKLQAKNHLSDKELALLHDGERLDTSRSIRLYPEHSDAKISMSIPAHGVVLITLRRV